MNLIDTGKFAEGDTTGQVQLYTLKNINGLVCQVTNFGARVVSLWIPDAEGTFADVSVGFSTYSDYLNANDRYYGATIGRYANRIYKGQFSLNGKAVKLNQNNGENHLHGGPMGFSEMIWAGNQLDDNKLELSYVSPDGEEGFPGNLSVMVLFDLTNDNELKIEYWATTDKSTVVNLTHHSFFNLKGEGNGTINDHILEINAEHYTPVDAGLIPTGEIVSVKGTPMDFRTPQIIGTRLNEDFEQLRFGGGYDHNWVLNSSDNELTFAASLREPVSGRVMEVYTNEPGLQFYGGNFMRGSDVGKHGKTLDYRTALCLETQHFPDSPNRRNFPTTVLNPEDEYYSVCIYRFRHE